MADPGDDHVSDSSGKCSRNTNPKMKDLADAHAKADQPLDRARELRKRAENEKLAIYRQKRRSKQSPDLDADEVESAWKPLEHRIKPHESGMRDEPLANGYLRVEYEEDEYLNVMDDDPEDQLEEAPSKDSDNDSEEEFEEDSMEDDDPEDDDGFDEPDN
ncbi:phosphopantothenoylcysteine decarboxylase subunit VHS3-like [Papaver somniferum]|uniref:phosphopantothenoylcysteine decarboxylase subunit VHS3-like n=1 Tax=Papaver somniferum TaxID=3469 RepID=UPI000E70454E|nr:phosphopantothenoylcysteine decarboxylase subunit VHS3-like [Papaver somniferum]